MRGGAELQVTGVDEVCIGLTPDNFSSSNWEDCCISGCYVHNGDHFAEDSPKRRITSACGAKCQPDSIFSIRVDMRSEGWAGEC